MTGRQTKDEKRGLGILPNKITPNNMYVLTDFVLVGCRYCECFFFFFLLFPSHSDDCITDVGKTGGEALWDANHKQRIVLQWMASMLKV